MQIQFKGLGLGFRVWQCCRSDFEHIAGSNHLNFDMDRASRNLGTDSINIEDMCPCGGCVVQKGVSKVAVYKDGEGNVHKYAGMQTPP